MGHQRFAGSLVPSRRQEPAAVEGPGLLATGLWGAGTRRHAEAELAEPEVLDLAPKSPSSAAVGRIRGQRTTVISQRHYRGRYVRAVAARGERRDVAWDATLRATAHLQSERRTVSGLAVTLYPDELLRRLRTRRPRELVLFVVDASGSMGGELTSLARRAAVRVLERAYVERARVALIAFRGDAARELLPPTDRVDRVSRSFADLPLGGTTPLASGLRLAAEVIEREARREPGLRPTLLLISDGRANIGRRPGHEAVLAEVAAAARGLARRPELRAVMLDTTERGKDGRPARWLAERLAARHVKLWRVAAGQADAALGVARVIE